MRVPPKIVLVYNRCTGTQLLGEVQNICVWGKKIDTNMLLPGLCGNTIWTLMAKRHNKENGGGQVSDLRNKERIRNKEGIKNERGIRNSGG